MLSPPGVPLTYIGAHALSPNIDHGSELSIAQANKIIATILRIREVLELGPIQRTRSNCTSLD